MTRITILALLTLAACSRDEKDIPDVSFVHPLPTIVVTTTATPTTSITTPTVTTLPATTVTVLAPPVTCGPDPDETHPPPCD